MPEQIIENYINEFLSGMHRKNALDFVAYLRAREMLFERGGDYWEGKLYWCIKCKNEYVCSILVGDEEKPGPGPWIIWSDNSNDSGSHWFEDFPLDGHMKEIAWKNVDFCGNCGYCTGGIRKTIFGKEFNNVCGTTFIFTDPDVEALECLEKLIDLRKNEISNIDNRGKTIYNLCK